MNRLISSLPLFFLLPAIPCLRADVTLPSLFSNHAVLQKSENVPVWGWADPDETVSINLDGVKAETKAGPDGKWKTSLNLKDKSAGPFEMLIEGKNKITISDVVIGEVWLCSGQSNMEYTLGGTLGAKEEIAQSANPLLRQFLVKKGTSVEPLEKCEGQWVPASPGTTAGFTAVGYYFGKALQKELQLPIGLVHSSWGGTPVEAWTSSPAMDQVPDLKATKDRSLEYARNYPELKKQFAPALAAWIAQNQREDKMTPDPTLYTGNAVPTETWTKVTLPGDLPKDLAKPGALWLRKEIDIPQDLENKEITILLEPISGFDTLYWNGTPVGKTTLETYSGNGAPRQYKVPAAQVKAGKTLLALRIYAPAEPIKFSGQANKMKAATVAINGEWLATPEYTLPDLEAAALAAMPKTPGTAPALQNTSTCLFNAMINPLVPYAIRGSIWYQGESNAGRAWQYRTAFPLMIQDWRNQWKQGDFPFYFCQLANWQDKAPTPGESAWAELREAQSVTLSLPNTGMANLIDLGESKDIHPRNKKDVGERLSLIALAKDYGKKISFSGPVYDSIKIEGNNIRVSFKNTDGGLTARPLPETQILSSMPPLTAPLVIDSPGSELQGFFVCGENKVWKWAQAKIDGETVLVSSPEIPAPIAVRYAWANNPTCNLYNGAGLPAFPFRSDDFPAATLNNKF